MFKVGDVVQPSNHISNGYWQKRATFWLARVDGYSDIGKLRIEWITGDPGIIGMKAYHRPDKFKLHMNGVDLMIQVL